MLLKTNCVYPRDCSHGPWPTILAGEYLFGNTGSALGRRGPRAPVAPESFPFARRPDHRQDASLERFGQRRPCVDHCHQVGISIVALRAIYVGFYVARFGKWRIPQKNAVVSNPVPPLKPSSNPSAQSFALYCTVSGLM